MGIAISFSELTIMTGQPASLQRIPPSETRVLIRVFLRETNGWWVGGGGRLTCHSNNWYTIQKSWKLVGGFNPSENISQKYLKPPPRKGSLGSPPPLRMPVTTRIITVLGSGIHTKPGILSGGRSDTSSTVALININYVKRSGGTYLKVKIGRNTKR